MSKLAITMFVAGVYGFAPLPANAQVDMDLDFGVGWSPDFEPVDFGFGKEGRTSSNPAGVCEGADAVDPLSRRAQSILNSWSSCHLYSDATYQAFRQDVPEGLHFAVNYIAYVEGKQMLNSDSAQWWEREKSNLAFKPITPGPEGIAPSPVVREPIDVAASAPVSAPQAVPRAPVTQQAEGAAPSGQLGACGLPYRSEQGREAQETLVRDGACEIAKSYLR